LLSAPGKINKSNTMNRVIFPVLCALLFAAGLNGCRTTQKEASLQPNIIFIMSDDHAAHAISAYGSIYEEYAPTPNIDRLAAEGMLLENVFCTNAICGPSRATIQTGKYSHKNGYYKNERGGRFNAAQWTYPKELQANGYQTAMVGKWHLQCIPQGFDYFRYHVGGGEQGFYWNPVYNLNGDTVQEEGYATDLTTDFALDWLANQRAEEKPFCLVLQYKAPHRNWDPDSQYVDLWEDIGMPYPTTFDDDYSTREETAGNTDMTMECLNRRDMKMKPPEDLAGRALQEWYGFGNQRADTLIPVEGMTLQEARKWKYQRYIKDYLACIRSVDDNIGRVLDYLEESGLDENTVVMYTSDQGFYLGDHGWFDKRFMYEPSLRMPFLIRYPGKLEPGSRNSDIITNIDFAPTILDIAGLQAPEEVQGKSFLDNLVTGKPGDWRQSMYYHYYEFPWWHHVQPHYGIRNQEYKLIHFYYNIDVWEFFDIQEDPDELVNQIDNPEYAEVIAEMKEELAALMKQYGDDASLDEMREITDRNFNLE
jgi:arylsulfatase A-like enzyme